MIKIHAFVAAVAVACFLHCSRLSSGRLFDRRRKTVDRRCWWGAEFTVKRTLTSSHESPWSAAFVGLTRTYSAFAECDSAVWMPCLPSSHLAPRLLVVSVVVIDSRGWRFSTAFFVPDSRNSSNDTRRARICRNYYDSSCWIRHDL